MASDAERVSAHESLLLGLLDALGGDADNRDFQVVLFLYCQESKSGQPYEFAPTKQGPYSFTCQNDLRRLTSHELIESDDQSWKLTTKGKGMVDRDKTLADFVGGLDKSRGDDLLLEAYRRFPYFAIKSDNAAAILKDDHAALTKVKAEEPKPVDEPLLTIGYEGRSLEAYLNILIRAGATLLCDVRGNPNSRKFGFAKSTLARTSGEVRLRYEHLPELGIPTSERRDLKTDADYQALFEDYKRTQLPHKTEALKTILDWIKAGEKVALTCYELDPRHCHRHCISDALGAHGKISVGHL